jgi:UDP-glucose 4-epimerase
VTSQLAETLQKHDPSRWSSLDSFYRGRRVLITGGLGFIGSNLTIVLSELGAHIQIIDSMIPDYGGNLFNIEPVRNRVHVNFSDVRDRSSLNYLVQQCDMMFNLAGTLSHVDSMQDPFTDLEINCVSQLSILESCRRFNPSVKIVFAGTRGQYGRTGGKPVDEDHPMHPVDVNGINNLAGESYHLLYNEVHGIRACSLRLTNTFGPRHQMRHPRQGVLNWFLRQIIDGETVRIFGNGHQVRDTNYVADVVEAFLLAMMNDGTDGKAFNVGGEALSLKQFVELAVEENRGGAFELVLFPEDSRKIEVGNYVADFTRFRELCEWKPRVDVREGIRRTLEYYREFRDYYWGSVTTTMPPRMPAGA